MYPLLIVVLPKYARAGRNSGERQITVCTKKQNNRANFDRHENVRPRTTRPTHPPTYSPTHRLSHPSTNQPTHHVLQQYSSTYSSKQMRWLMLELRQRRPVQRRKQNTVPKKKTGPPPIGTKALTHVRNDPHPPTHPPTQPPNHPPTDQPVHPPNTPITMCYGSKPARTAATRCVWPVLFFSP